MGEGFVRDCRGCRGCMDSGQWDSGMWVTNCKARGHMITHKGHMGSVCSGSGHAALCLLITTSISGGCPPPPIGYGCLGRPLLLLMLPGSVDRVRHLATVCVLSHARLYPMLRS